MGPISNVPTSALTPAGSRLGSATAHVMAKGAERLRLSTLEHGTDVLFLGKMISVWSSSVGTPVSGSLFFHVN
jgi:hypothetical protein